MKTIQNLLIRPWFYLGMVLLGTSLKFYHIESKFFWIDEIATIMHTSGISDMDYYNLVPVNEVKNITFYHDLLHLNTQNYTIWSQLKGLFSMPQLAPLHHALLIFWHRIVGDDYVHYRLFNVFIFIITLPFLFLLCKMLLKSSLAGWIGISLFSISPFFNIYTQEARYYILWAFFLIVLNYLLLKGIENKKIKWWIAYSFIGIMAMYTSLLSIIMIFGHLVFVWFFKKEVRLTYSINLLIIFLGYLPWIISIVHYQQNIVGSTNWLMNPGKTTFWIPIIGQVLGFAHIFNFLEGHAYYFFWFFHKIPTINELVISFIFSVIILVFIVTAIIYVLRKTDKEIKYFLIMTILPGILYFYVYDIVRNSLVSYVWRYHTLIFIGILMIVTCYLSYKIIKGKILFIFIYIGLIVISSISTLKIISNRCHHALPDCQQCIEIEDVFLNAYKPLLITDFSYWTGIGAFFRLTAQWDIENLDILRVWNDVDYAVKVIEDREYSEIYIIYLSDKLRQDLSLKSGKKMELIKPDKRSPLWQMSND